MGETALRCAVYADLFDLPDNLVGEILNGILETHPRPAPRHARTTSSMGMKIGSPFDHGQGGPGGWWILDEPELHLNADIMVPDLAGWRRERMPTLPETAWFECVPDWICEVISPATGRIDRAIKMPLYAHYGVHYLWIVDPDLNTLEAYELQKSTSGNKWLLLATLNSDQTVALPPFDAIEFNLSILWG